MNKIYFIPKILLKSIKITNLHVINKRINIIKQNVNYIFSSKIKKNTWLNNYKKKWNLRNKYLTQKKMYNINLFLLQGRNIKKKKIFKKWYFSNKNMHNRKKKFNYHQTNFLIRYNKKKFSKLINL